jgi:iron complex outermembrane receptor protein
MKTIFKINMCQGLSGILYAMLAVALAGLPALSYSQELEEIIVTAQKREQNLQEIGISVTAFSGDLIRELGFTNTTDVVSMTPGLTYTVPNAESSQINFFLRGVGLNDFADANENPVAVYLDDVYRPAMGGLSFQMYDMERVEVLRGPQGSLFGRNTTGGLVHYITKRPTEDLEGYLSLTGGSNSQFKFEGAVSGPLGETVSGRLSVATNIHDGYTENRGTGPDYNETDAQAARGQLLFAPNEDFDVLVQAYYSDNDAAVGAWQHQATKLDSNAESVPLGPNEQDMSVDCNADGMLDASDLRPAPGTDCFGYRDSDGDPFAGEYDRNGKVEVENSGITLNADWDVGNFIVTSITAFQNVDRLQSEDTEAGPFPLIQPTFIAETDTFTQELRIAGERDTFRWLAGVYYFDNDVEGHYALDL